MKIGEVVLVISVLLLCLAFKVNAQVQPSRIFSNGMVLQREVAVPVWGTATAGAEVTVSINGNTVSGTASADGSWKVNLSAMAAGGPFTMTIASETKTLTYSDVYVGDVWLASGQSNMELALSNTDNAATEIASANNPMIRQFKIPKTIAKDPTTALPAGCAWTPATSANAGNFSAAAYYFAKSLNADLQIPIGIINTSYGGSRIEAWMSEEMLGYDEDDISLLAWDNTIYQERQPTLCYNQMLKPLEEFTIKGFIWYQGESNADFMDEAKEYGALFKKMITSWRANWGLGDLPFIWVQLPNYSTVYDAPQAWDNWPILRANQSATLSLPNTGEAVTIDIGDVDIHPKNKKPVGERLALCARKIAFNEDLVYSGPRYKSHQLLPDGKIVIKYEHIGGGLVAKNSTDGTVNGFAVADSIGNLSWANASIQGDSVIVWSDEVKNPSIVRYAWETNPATINLYNAEGLPAAPFKVFTTDPGFVIKSFAPTATTIERWETTVLTWETYGASSVTLNDEAVDPISGKRIQPIQTTSYTLKVKSQQYPDSILTKTVTIEVVDPKPTISIKTDVAGITSPGTEITLIATATAPRERTIKQVDFYIDNTLVGTDTTSPYELKWTPTQAGSFSFTAKVTDNTDISVTSAPSSIYVTKLKMLIYEAEKATFTGTGSVKTNKNVSNGKYLDMNSNGWLITFDNVEAPADGVYPLSIRYLLNYESPKSQVLIVNDNNLGEIKFTAPNTTTWSTYALNVTLNKGMNTIQLKDSWGWMSFDYIAIAVEDTSTTGVKKMEINRDNSLFYNVNNPVRTSTDINYLLPRDGKVILDLYSSDGKKIKTLVNEMKTAGKNSARLDASQLKAGIYLLKIQLDSMNETKKIVLVK